MMNLIPFFNSVEFRTDKFWQHTARDMMIAVSDTNDDALSTVLFQYFDKVDVVRCFLGMQAEFLEHEIDPGLDEFADIIFYTARVANYFNISKITYNAVPISRSFKYLEAMTQPVRNLLRPDGLKEKHEVVLLDNLNKFIGVLFAHMAFSGYTETEIIEHLERKLSPRYQ